MVQVWIPDDDWQRFLKAANGDIEAAKELVKNAVSNADPDDYEGVE